MNNAAAGYDLLPLVVYSALAFALVGIMVGLSYVLGPRLGKRANLLPFESGIMPLGDTKVRFPVQFYLVAMFFVIFDLEMVFIFAWAVALRAAGWTGYIAMLGFLILLLIALAYLWRSGALEWGPQKRRLPAARVRAS